LEKDMDPIWIVVCIILLVIAIPVVMYNALVRLRNQCRESWSDVDTELKRRHDLIPNLVETVKGYAGHERALFERVASLRREAMAGGLSPKGLAQRENQLLEALSGVFAVAESYPQLKADEQFQRLMHELVITEDRIQAARRFYNANVRDYNTRCQTFPSNMIAGWGGFHEEEFFEISDAHERSVPVVNLQETS